MQSSFSDYRVMWNYSIINQCVSQIEKTHGQTEKFTSTFSVRIHGCAVHSIISPAVKCKPCGTPPGPSTPLLTIHNHPTWITPSFPVCSDLLSSSLRLFPHCPGLSCTCTLRVMYLTPAETGRPVGGQMAAMKLISAQIKPLATASAENIKWHYVQSRVCTAYITS